MYLPYCARHIKRHQSSQQMGKEGEKITPHDCSPQNSHLPHGLRSWGSETARLRVPACTLRIDWVIQLMSQEVNQSKWSWENHKLSIFHLNYQFGIIDDKFKTAIENWSLLKYRCLSQELLNPKDPHGGPRIRIHCKAPQAILVQPDLHMCFDRSLGMRLSEINPVNSGRQRGNQSNQLFNWSVYTKRHLMEWISFL